MEQKKKILISRNHLKLHIGLLDEGVISKESLAGIMNELEDAYLNDIIDVDGDSTWQLIAFLADIDLPEYTGLCENNEIYLKALEILNPSE